MRVLLPGESLHEFEAIRQMMVDDVQPETNIEWLWTPDLVELSWETGSQESSSPRQGLLGFALQAASTLTAEQVVS